MEKKIEMVCVSDMEGFDQELYESQKAKLSKHLARFGWTYGECVFEEDGKVYCCKPAACWFLIPDITEDDC